MSEVVYYHPLVWKHIDRLLQAHQEDINPLVLSTFYGRGRGAGKYGNGANPDLNAKHYYSPANPIHWIGKLLDNHSPVSRVGMLNPIKVQYEQIPNDFANFNKDFETVCISRAQELWDKYKDITVFWSGGLDSTCLSLAMIETKPSDATLRLVGTSDSVSEYENFFNRFKSIITIVEADKLFDSYYLTTHDTTVITGEAGDQIFCGAIADEFENKDIHWQEVIYPTLVDRLKNPKLKRQPEWYPGERQSVLDALEQIVSACPVKIDRYSDFLWWLTFTTKMNYVTHKFPTLVADHNLAMPKQTRPDTFIPFYLSNDFQRWSIVNQQIKLPGGVETYKQPIKDFIIKFFGDPEFITNKGKELSTMKTVGSSWHSVWIKNEDANYIRLSNGTYHSRTNDLSIQQLESIILDN